MVSTRRSTHATVEQVKDDDAVFPQANLSTSSSNVRVWLFIIEFVLISSSQPSLHPRANCVCVIAYFISIPLLHFPQKNPRPTVEEVMDEDEVEWLANHPAPAPSSSHVRLWSFLRHFY
jgi:hypothetical protein